MPTLYNRGSSFIHEIAPLKNVSLYYGRWTKGTTTAILVHALRVNEVIGNQCVKETLNLHGAFVGLQSEIQLLGYSCYPS